jgi:hypothetical protein
MITANNKMPRAKKVGVAIQKGRWRNSNIWHGTGCQNQFWIIPGKILSTK